MKRYRTILLAIGSILVTVLACTLPPISGTVKDSSGNTATPNAGGGGGGSGSGGSGGGGGGSGSGGGSLAGTPQVTPIETVTPTPTDFPTPSASGPYIVKQTHSLGGEKISGQVCSLTMPFTVLSATPKVSWAFNFIPQSASAGGWTYAYNIASAGETHSASGKYSVSAPAKDGSLTLTMTGRDNVAFKGFSGPFPVNYSFDLVPSGQAPCP